jgi:TonB-dependent SusC/RagA subfamily outer membrane receptor
MDRFRWLMILALGLAAPAALAAQERGTVTGVVVEAGTMRPLSGVQISVAGTQLGTLTNQEGRYIIMNVPAGTREVRATRIGYAQATQQVAVAAGETVTADFTVTESAVALEGLVVTATGETQRVRERGNVVGQIQVAEMDLAPITTMSDVLQGRTAGMTVQRSAGTTGAGSRVRIRGSASASLGNQPLLIIDGIRVNESPNSFSIGLGGQAPSRLEDLNPDEIENIEILKGPAAAALYGTAAATGVIQVTTRRGRAGPARWTAYTEGGLIQERNEWPGNYMRLGDWGGGDIDLCPTLFEAAGWCEPTGETLYWNPLMGGPRRQQPGARAREPLPGREPPEVRPQRIGRHRADHLLPVGGERGRKRDLPEQQPESHVAPGEPPHLAARRPGDHPDHRVDHQRPPAAAQRQRPGRRHRRRHHRRSTG